MFSDNFRQLLDRRKISCEEIAERLGISRQAVSKWSSGAALPDINNLMALSELLRVTTDSLLKDKSPCDGAGENGALSCEEKLISFILEAGRKTYAGKGAESAAPSRPFAHDLSYEKDGFLYIDSYVGGGNFSGEEIVYEAGKPVWAMNYTGRTLSEGFSGDFLKEALLLRPEDKPYRGPELYTSGDFTYHSAVTGGFRWFQGQEEIYLSGEKIYECFYHGGVVK